VTPVLLDPQDPGKRSIGSFVYAGGIEITDTDGGTAAELSDLHVDETDRLVAVSDRGHFLEARLMFDEAQRLSGLTDARVVPLRDEKGAPLSDTRADAEGLAVLPNGDRLVSFERDHRVWIYRPDGSSPRPAAHPQADLPANEGMEALTRYPAGGPDAYLVGSEGGRIWLCGLSIACRESRFGALVPAGLGLTALSAYGADGRFAMLARAYDPALGVRIAVRLIVPDGPLDGRVLDEMTMAAPLTVDNFEGIAVVPRSDGGIRLFILSDDNGSPEQRTYLLAFDWHPSSEKQPRTSSLRPTSLARWHSRDNDESPGERAPDRASD
jgi:hypothetical protein